MPTGLLDQKYGIHPIYSSCLFLDVRVVYFYRALVHAQTPLKLVLFGYVMADLVLQDFSDPSSKNLPQVLCSETRKWLMNRSFMQNKRLDNRPDQSVCL
jgi:hypothetical protein